MGFAGKRVFVTGAGRGLGAPLAVVFADQGAEISLMDAEQTGAFTRAELEKWRKFLKR